MAASDSSRPVTVVTPTLLRGWPLPPPGDSKYGRGQIVVLGGARRSPGAAILAGVAALRVGAGRLTLAVAASVATHVAVAVQESGVVPLPESDDGRVLGAGIGAAEADLAEADTVIVGPGLDDAGETLELVRALPGLVGAKTCVVLDAYALGVLADATDVASSLEGRLILTPNKSEAARLLGREIGDTESDLRELADRYRAVVSCFGTLASPAGEMWRVGTGGGGLATSGSGDVLAGAIGGLSARGADPTQAAAWATYVHAAAGDRLSARVGPLGYLAHELLEELPRVLVEISAS